MEPFVTNPTIYTSRENGRSFNIEIGNEFNVLCISSGEFSGGVTWIKKGNGGNN